jgi:hypothetical protein
MKRLHVTSYRYRSGLDADDLRDLTKKFAEVGNAPGVIAHYSRLDGSGGFVVQEDIADHAAAFEVTLRYAPWIEFEVYPVATIEETFPVIQKVYG